MRPANAIVWLPAFLALAAAAAFGQDSKELLQARTADEARRALKNGADPTTVVNNGGILGSPLHHAIRTNRFAVVRVLLEAGVNPNDRDDSYSVLSAAVAGGNPAVLRLLIAAGAAVHATDMQGGPLVYAARDRRADLVRILLESGADPRTSYKGRLLGEIGGGAVAKAVEETLAGKLQADPRNSSELDAPLGRFKRACALALLDRPDEAIVELSMAVVADPEWVRGRLTDPDLNGLRSHLGFQHCVVAVSEPFEDFVWTGAHSADGLPEWVPVDQRASQAYSLRLARSGALELSIKAGSRMSGGYDLRNGWLSWGLNVERVTPPPPERPFNRKITQEGKASVAFVAPGLLKLSNLAGRLVPDGYYRADKR